RNHIDQAVVRAEIVNGENVGMVEGAGGAGFLFEPQPPRGIGSYIVRQHLERDLAPQPGVARPVDFAHTSSADRRNDFIGTEPGSRGKGHASSLQDAGWCSSPAPNVFGHGVKATANVHWRRFFSSASCRLSSSSRATTSLCCRSARGGS